MKNISLFLLALALGFSGVARAQDLHDGKIPAKYLSDFKKFTGEYPGRVDGMNTTMNLQIADDGKVALSFNPSILPACQAAIGDAFEMGEDEDDGVYKLEDLKFAFNPGNCRDIRGRELKVSFDFDEDSSKIESKLKIWERTEWRRDCWTRCDSNGRCWQDCNETPVNTYIGGKFEKSAARK